MKRHFISFNPLTVPLTGMNLIEASAGTGKTYSIAALFLRLVLESHLTPEQILVVTFTNAATDELKARIRKNLVAAKAALTGKAPANPFVAELTKNIRQPEAALLRIQNALVNFDCAAIFTIHGFCQRVLREYAFETGGFFESELVAEADVLLRGVVEDFWRRHVAPGPLEFLAEAPEGVAVPLFFASYLPYLHHPDIVVEPSVEAPGFAMLPLHRRLLRSLRGQWRRGHREIVTLLRSASLSGRSYGSLTASGAGNIGSRRDQTIAALAGAMDLFLDPTGPGVPLFKGFEKFTAGFLEKSALKNQAPPAHPFFQSCELFLQNAQDLAEECRRHLLYLKTLFLDFFPKALALQKDRRQIQFFEDLLARVRQILLEPQGKALQDGIREKYRAALIDEFQDTDPQQYEIFTRLFAGQGRVLFMIGDPKQAIYGFRGADVFSYMDAARRAEKGYTLTHNWRSTPGLVRAVNTLFSNVVPPFLFEAIPFEKARATAEAGGAQKEPAGSSLVIWRLQPSPENPSLIPKQRLKYGSSEPWPGKLCSSPALPRPVHAGSTATWRFWCEPTGRPK